MKLDNGSVLEVAERIRRHRPDEIVTHKEAGSMEKLSEEGGSTPVKAGDYQLLGEHGCHYRLRGIID
ncbi:MAG: hypothetical protein WB239_11340 [Acidimicrobiia bacterium]